MIYRADKKWDEVDRSIYKQQVSEPAGLFQH